ncbi:MAG: PDR/VanB family oxidoreductase [Beijerinckiaceae bacterium]|nr:PDR/VanB family oxidoreductase [Beijerinckiaceae bacterium]
MTDDTLLPVIVAKKTEEAHKMVSFELADPNGADLPAFSAGSHIDVTIPGGIVRQYSLCNSSSERKRYVIGVWNDANSRGGSKALHEKVNAGDILQVGLPRNRFRVPRSTKRAILLARGIGVTPILSIADYLKSQEIPFELHYVYALMSPKSFEGMIKESNFAENTKYYLEAREHNQLLDPAIILSDQPEDTQLFICGVDWWQDPIINTAKQKGFAEERIHVERFTAKVPPAVLDKVFDVKIASSGIVYKVPGDKTVTAFLEEKGVKIPTSCEQGMCGTCKVKVLEGEADHRDKRLTPQQKEEGYFLACVSRAKSPLLVLDL